MGRDLPEVKAPPIGLDPGAYTKNERRLVFIAARRRGETVKQASALAGVHEQTGWKWNRILRQEAAQSAARSSILTKDDNATLLTAIARDEAESAAYRVAAAKAVADIMGHNAPTRSQVLTISVPPSVMAWIEGWEPEPPAPQALPPNATTPSAIAVTASTPRQLAGARQEAQASEGGGGAPKGSEGETD